MNKKTGRIEEMRPVSIEAKRDVRREAGDRGRSRPTAARLP